MMVGRVQMAGHTNGTHAPRDRFAPQPGDLARRRFLVTATKYVLPLLALGLLTAVALWPDLVQRRGFIPTPLSGVSGQLDGTRLRHARYHGVNEKGEPYTLTTDTAKQLDSDRIELTKPQGDLTQANGVWLNLKADHGIFAQKANTLDLWSNVVLYRDDGTTLTTASATVDVKGGSAVGGQPVHAEGPFGVLDADGGFTITDKGTAIQFSGNTHLIMNAASK
jgi:lipopolysaccharide export system protein LptC